MSARKCVAALVLTGVALAASGCAATRFHERERLSDRAAVFDANSAVAFIRAKMEAAREGAFGGFGAAAAGGCGCE